MGHIVFIEFVFKLLSSHDILVMSRILEAKEIEGSVKFQTYNDHLPINMDFGAVL